MGAVEKANWIWTPAWKLQDDTCPRLVYFRKNFYLEQTSAYASIQISADTRYKLYINGQLIETGPSKGDRQVWFMDEMDIAASLCPGENVLAVAVLRYPITGPAGNHSLFRTQTPGLFLKGGAYSASGACLA